MATYTVQAPDGKTVTLEGPEGASQADVIAQAQKLYQPKAAAPKAAPVIRPQDAQAGLDRGSQLLEQKIKNFSPEQQQQARDLYFQKTADLRVKSAMPASTKRNAKNPGGQAETRANRNASVSGNFLNSLKAGITRGAFGLPERLAAAGARFLPSEITGNTTDASYDQILEQIRQNTDAELDQSTAGNILGQIMSGAPIGGAAAKTIGMLPGVGRAVTAATAAAPKRTAIATVIGGGAAGGAAQAAGEGSDVSTGAGIGAAAGPVGLGAGKLLAFVSRPVGDFLRLTNADKLLSRFTNASAEDMRAAADEFRRTTGAEPTLYEIMPLADRNNLAKKVIGASPETSERTAAAVRQRVANVGPEMGRTVRGATAQRRGRIIAQMSDDMNAARGADDAAPLPGVARAAESPVDLEAFRGQEARARMEPVDHLPVANTIEEMFPRSLQPTDVSGEVEEVYSQPELNSLIQRAAGSLSRRLSPENPAAISEGISVNDVTRIIDKLGDIPPSSPDFLTAQTAVNHLLDEISSRQPAAAGVTEEMRNAFAARSRQMEGMAEGARTRTRESVPVENRGQAQTVTNAYDTPEGEAGRFLGQGNALTREMAGTPQDALRSIDDLASSGETQRALAQNLGPQAADTVTNAAEAQGRSVRALASVGSETSKEADSVSLENLGPAILALNPQAMVFTKIRALQSLLSWTHMPQSRANALVDMLFSQNPAQTNRAIGLLNGAGERGRQFLSDLGKTITIGQVAAGQQNSGSDLPVAAPSVIPEASAEEIPEPEAPVEEEIADDVPYGRAVIEGIFPEAEITSDHRGPDNPLYDPNSGHAGDDTVDVRPIPGMTFDEFLQTIEDEGYTIVKAYDESKGPADPSKAGAWGPHWHVQVS
jgi:hypothetical protein